MRRRHTTFDSNAYHEALRQASERVGTEEKAFRWLIRFSQTNLLGLSPGEWLDIQHEVAVFTRFGPHGRLLRHAPLATPDWVQIWQGGYYWHPGNIELLPSKDEVAICRQFVRDQLASWQKWESIEFKQPFKTLSVVRSRGQRGIPFLQSEDEKMVFAVRCAMSIADYGEDLKECSCGSPFYPSRSKQKFCSPRCLNRATQEKFRKKPKDGRLRSRPRVKAIKGHTGKSATRTMRGQRPRRRNA